MYEPRTMSQDPTSAAHASLVDELHTLIRENDNTNIQNMKNVLIAGHQQIIDSMKLLTVENKDELRQKMEHTTQTCVDAITENTTEFHILVEKLTLQIRNGERMTTSLEQNTISTEQTAKEISTLTKFEQSKWKRFEDQQAIHEDEMHIALEALEVMKITLNTHDSDIQHLVYTQASDIKEIKTMVENTKNETERNTQSMKHLQCEVSEISKTKYDLSLASFSPVRAVADKCRCTRTPDST